MSKIKPILFIDFDGTICFDKYWRSLPKDKYDQVQQIFFGADRTLVMDWMRGKYSAEEINHLLADKIGAPFGELWNLFVKDCATMQVSQDILKRIHALKNKYIVILVTGNMDSFNRFTIPALKLDTFFDHINNSYFDGRFRDDYKKEIFNEYATALGVPISECILIDDSVKVCNTFTALGGVSYLISPEHPIESYLSMLEK